VRVRAAVSDQTCRRAVVSGKPKARLKF
jgi:hypothetical protein